MVVYALNTSLITPLQAALAWGVFTRLGWRWLLALSSLPLLALTVLFPVLPESPFFLAATGSTGAAAAVLQRVARANGRSLPPGTLQAHAPPTVRSTQGLGFR